MMQGDPKVKEALQEAITLEASQALRYQLDALDAERFGLSLSEGLMTRHEQCEAYMKDLVSRLLFLEGAPVLAPTSASTHNDFGSLIADHIAAETAIVERYAELCRICWDAGDMDNFHYFQHLSKWHRQGGNGFKGHLSWWQKQQWKFKKFGETDYLESKV